MQNIKRYNQIYLSGGGNEKQSFSLDKFFFNKLPKNGSFLYIPIALRGHKFYSTAHLWMKNITELHNRADVHFETANDLKRYSLVDLKKFNGVYIGGGNTWNLIQELKNSGFVNILIQYFETGGQLYGGSAGAIIMGKRIDVNDDENNLSIRDVSGFDLLNKFSVVCHFKNEQNERFKNWAINNNLPIICLPEETGLIIEKNIAFCVGGKSCFIYFAGGTKKEVNPGDFFNL